MARIQKKNNIDLQNVQDLQTLEKLQGNSNQIDSMADQASQEESDHQDQLQEQNQVNQISNLVQNEIKKQEKEVNQDTAEKADANSENVAKIKDLSSKLGVTIEQSDYALPTKRDIAQVMVQRAIKAGKSQAQIKKALTS